MVELLLLVIAIGVTIIALGTKLGRGLAAMACFLLFIVLEAPWSFLILAAAVLLAFSLFPDDEKKDVQS